MKPAAYFAMVGFFIGVPFGLAFEKWWKYRRSDIRFEDKYTLGGAVICMILGAGFGYLLQTRFPKKFSSIRPAISYPTVGFCVDLVLFVLWIAYVGLMIRLDERYGTSFSEHYPFSAYFPAFWLGLILGLFRERTLKRRRSLK